MSSTKVSDDAVNRARATICEEFARMLKLGAFTVRVRIVKADDELREVWFYAHRADGWEKQPVRVTDRGLGGALQESLEMLASKGHHDEWSAKQHSAADFCDTDIQFHPQKLEEHLDDRLESVLAGLLFRDRHDSKKDVRRSIHRRRRGV
jgi:hypothetical protein